MREQASRPLVKPETGRTGADEIRIPIGSDSDVVTARQKGRELATELGFTSEEAVIIAAAISDLARNVVLYAKEGEIVLSMVKDGERRGIAVVVRGEEPGIPDAERALQKGCSAARGLGLVSPEIKRLMDEFDVASDVGRGTIVAVKKWRT